MADEEDGEVSLFLLGECLDDDFFLPLHPKSTLSKAVGLLLSRCWPPHYGLVER